MTGVQTCALPILRSREVRQLDVDREGGKPVVDPHLVESGDECGFIARRRGYRFGPLGEHRPDGRQCCDYDEDDSTLVSLSSGVGSAVHSSFLVGREGSILEALAP